MQAQVAAGAPGVILAVYAPELDLDYLGALGTFERGSERALCGGDLFRAASVTKAFTATVAVRLAERSVWDLDRPITLYAPPSVLECLDLLPGLDSSELTIRRLLGHTSGLPDYFFDEGFQVRVAREPDHMWRPQELLQAAVDVGKVLFSPGSDFSYGDTGYVLVGLAAEHVLQASLAEVYREEILDQLGMRGTYLEWHEPSRAREVSHHYEGDEDLHDRNTSFDWAGGGLVTTAPELVRFFRGLYDGRLVSPQGLAEMMRWRKNLRWRVGSSARYAKYGLGLGSTFAYGQELVGVTGVWGAFVWRWLAKDATVAGTVNMVGADRAALLDAIVHALAGETERRIR